MTTEELIKLLYQNPVGARLTQEFGVTPYSSVYRANSHTGIDLATAKEPAYIKSPVDGEVFRDDDFNLYQGYGRGVWIKFITKTNVLMTFVLGHFSENYVTVGDKVQRGQIVGKQGKTGFATGLHVHAELYHGTANPYLLKSDAQFVSKFVDPRKLDEYLDSTDEMINQENIKKIKELTKEKEDLIQLLGQAILLNDNRTIITTKVPELSEDSKTYNLYANSPEKSGILNELYRTMLGRGVDDSGKKFWKSKSVLEIIRGIAVSPELQRKVLNIIYVALLDREIDETGFETYKDKDPYYVIEEVKKSEEYINKPK